MALAIKTLSNTVLKLSTKQATELSQDEKFLVKEGWNAPIKSYQELDNHYYFELGDLNGIKLYFTNDEGRFNKLFLWKEHGQILENGKVKSQSNPEVTLLHVPYFTQRDNYTQAYRTCNSSACAMVLAYEKPGVIKSDNEYLREVLIRGDSTDHSVQTKVLKHFGLDSEFCYNLSYKDLDSQLHENHPVVIGLLHRGTRSNPTGGHMVTVIGKSKKGYIVNDPFGNMLTNYYDEKGKGILYPYHELDARWLCGNPYGGWGRIIL